MTCLNVQFLFLWHVIKTGVKWVGMALPDYVFSEAMGGGLEEGSIKLDVYPPKTTDIYSLQIQPSILTWLPNLLQNADWAQQMFLTLDGF